MFCFQVCLEPQLKTQWNLECHAHYAVKIMVQNYHKQNKITSQHKIKWLQVVCKGCRLPLSRISSECESSFIQKGSNMGHLGCGVVMGGGGGVGVI